MYDGRDMRAGLEVADERKRRLAFVLAGLNALGEVADEVQFEFPARDTDRRCRRGPNYARPNQVPDLVRLPTDCSRSESEIYGAAGKVADEGGDSGVGAEAQSRNTQEFSCVLGNRHPREPADRLWQVVPHAKRYVPTGCKRPRI